MMLPVGSSASKNFACVGGICILEFGTFVDGFKSWEASWGNWRIHVSEHYVCERLRSTLLMFARTESVSLVDGLAVEV